MISARYKILLERILHCVLHFKTTITYGPYNSICRAMHTDICTKIFTAALFAI